MLLMLTLFTIISATLERWLILHIWYILGYLVLNHQQPPTFSKTMCGINYICQCNVSHTVMPSILCSSLKLGKGGKPSWNHQHHKWAICTKNFHGRNLSFSEITASCDLLTHSEYESVIAKTFAWIQSHWVEWRLLSAKCTYSNFSSSYAERDSSWTG